MLSHIVSLVNSYEQENGARPNLAYMNKTHYTYLCQEMPGVMDHSDVAAILGIDIALSEMAVHPHAATVCYADENILVS